MTTFVALEAIEMTLVFLVRALFSHVALLFAHEASHLIFSVSASFSVVARFMLLVLILLQVHVVFYWRHVETLGVGNLWRSFFLVAPLYVAIESLVVVIQVSVVELQYRIFCTFPVFKIDESIFFLSISNQKVLL